jgi:hypothetical protein
MFTILKSILHIIYISIFSRDCLLFSAVFDKHDRLRVERIKRRSEPSGDLLLVVWQQVSVLLPAAPCRSCWRRYTEN